MQLQPVTIAIMLAATVLISLMCHAALQQRMLAVYLLPHALLNGRCASECTASPHLFVSLLVSLVLVTA